MLVICVQVVNSKIFEYSTLVCQLLCLKHINQKKEKEQKLMVSGLEVSQKLEETLH